MSLSGLPFEHIGEFRLDRLIQSGPYTLSLKGWQPSLQRPVFIKLLRPQSEQHQQWLERFRREARISARLKHPNIVDVYTLGDFEGYAYMAMAYVDGLSLRQVVEQQGRLSLQQSCLILRQILPALQLSHDQGIVHRDIKPGNLLIDRQGLVRVTDFGLAHLGQDVAMTQQGAILGTPAYMAPEQITGEEVRPATDIFSLGATFYELLTGEKAFGGETYSACLQKILNEDPAPLSTARPDLPQAWDELIAAMLRKEPNERPASAAEVLKKLKSLSSIDEEAARKELVGIVASLMPEEEDEREKEIKAPRAPASKKVKKSGWLKITLPLVLAAVVLLIYLVIKPFGGSEQASTEKQATKEEQSPPESLLAQDDLRPVGIQEQKDTIATPVSLPPEKEERKEQEHSTFPVEADTTTIALQPPPVKKTDDPARVTLSIEPWANIRLDGQPVDSMASTLELELPAGEHEIVLTHPQFAPYVMTLDVTAGERKQASFSFLQQAGFLNIQVRPWAEVYLDGQFVDNTPLSRLLVCPAGERVLELRNPSFETFRQVLNVTRGDTLNIFHVMK